MSRAASTDRGAPARATDRLAPDERGLGRAVRLLAAGGLVAFPTETVYGLGADGRDPRAVAALYAAKGRPRFNPLIAHVPDTRAALVQGRFNEAAERLARAFWPGPLTLVVPVSATGQVCELARAGLSTIGLRVPGHPVAQDLLRRCGFPVVAPSANRSGHVSPTKPAHVAADLDGRIDAILEGGDTEIGIESTIVACVDAIPRLLRPGGLAREEIERILGQGLELQVEPDGRPIAPGALASHYAPRARVRLAAREVAAGDAVLLFGPAEPAGLGRAAAALNLSPTGDLVEAASRLFGHLRVLDASGAQSIAVMPIPDHGLGAAINDRLRRAAAER